MQIPEHGRAMIDVVDVPGHDDVAALAGDATQAWPLREVVVGDVVPAVRVGHLAISTDDFVRERRVDADLRDHETDTGEGSAPGLADAAGVQIRIADFVTG